MNIFHSVIKINGIGATLSKKLKKMGIETIHDLLYYFPFRHEDWSRVKPITELQDGDNVTVRGRIEVIANKRSFRTKKTVTEAVISENDERMKVVWFNQPFIIKNLHAGDEVFLSGKVTFDYVGMKMVSPVYEKASVAAIHTARIVPIYPLTQGVTAKQIRHTIELALSQIGELPDWIPEYILDKYDLVSITGALRGIHFPENFTELGVTEKRLKFDELFLLQLRAEKLRLALRESPASEIKFQEEKTRDFVQRLSFTLTKKQKISAWEILRDLERSVPMNRLLMGDVGSGKTVVAAIAAHSALVNDYSVAVMAPTEILAEQHFKSFAKLFSHTNFVIGILTNTGARTVSSGGESEKITKKKFAEQLRTGEIQFVVGTHALLFGDLKFARLGLVVVDEQHRFGVGQRKKLRELNSGSLMPHFLSMTATPIPRSLALTIYGDLDISILDEMPPGRKPVMTRVVEESARSRAYDFIRAEVKKGRQVFVICPLVEAVEKTGGEEKVVEKEVDKFGLGLMGASGGDDLERKSVMAEYEKLSKEIFSDLKVGFLHGRLKGVEKQAVMESFVRNEIQILVSTSVVEVGVDIPNATVMMIEDAERFGLAQLHQFRGRVGRGVDASYCLLFSKSRAENATRRLKFFSENTNGFRVAEYDLGERGPGEVYGRVQSGLMNLRLASLMDTEIIRMAREAARGFDFRKYPSVSSELLKKDPIDHLE